MSDSQLIVRQIQWEYETKDDCMACYLTMVESRLEKLDEWVIRQVSCEENGKANTLAGIVATLLIKEAVMLPVYLKVSPLITPERVCNTSQTNLGWMLNIVKYLRTGEVLGDEKQACKLRIQATHFTLINDQLYRQSFRGPYLKFFSKPNAKYDMSELHEGVCGNHPGGWTLTHRAYMQGYYWPTMKHDAKNYVKRCDRCQRYATIPRVPSEVLNLVTSPWPFA